ncbi:MAG: hypothetical protein J7578_14085, partial [Chitinophagaceae bacterium]|nr:hypothetical protein [Chitinophagaceae bacterium]
YRLNNRYLADLALRRDGNTRFGPGKRFGNFGSLGLGWIITEEDWAQKNFPSFLTFLKPSVNYGITGSDQVGEFRYLTQWGNSGIQDVPTIIGYDSVVPKIPQLQANEDFHWSTSRQINLSLEIGILNRINIILNAYRNRTNDQLVSFPTGVYTGFSNVTANSPAEVENKGWSISISAEAIKTKDFSWNISFNTSRKWNKLLSYPNLELSPWATTYKVGESVDLRYMTKYLGVDPATGELMFVDQNKDGLIKSNSSVVPGTADDDRIISVNIMPQFQGYMMHSFRYKNFNLSLNFTVSRFDAPNLLNGRNGTMQNIGKWEYENRWTTVGQEALAPRLTVKQSPQGAGSLGMSDGAYTRANFIRLGQASFNYLLSEKLAKKIGMQGMNIGLNGNNLFLLTNYQGMDPEKGNNPSGQPLMSTISLTVNCNF